MNNKLLKIADLRIEISGDCPDGAFAGMESYDCRDAKSPDLRIWCKTADRLPALPLSENYGVKNIIEEFGKAGERYLSQDRDGNKSYATITYNQTFDAVECTLVDVTPLGGETLESRFRVAIGECVLNGLPAFGGITFHASAISYRNDAILFAAPSGTGKSTQTALWRQVFPNDTAYINDDAPVIRRRNGVLHAYGTPWAGTSGINGNIFAPIKAIIVVKRGVDNTLRPVEGEEKLLRLLRTAREQRFPPQRRRQTEMLFDIASEIPMYELCCNISKHAVEAVHRLLYG